MEHYMSAIVISPPKDQWLQIQQIREKEDKAYQRWMPHINLIYPFIEIEKYPDIISKLKTELENFPSFNIILDRFDYFSHSKKSKTLFLKPDPNSIIILRNLYQKLKALLSLKDDSLEREFEPHLTLGQYSSDQQVQAKIKEFEKSWQPIRFTVNNLDIITRTEHTPFQLIDQISLKASVEPKKAIKSDSYYQQVGDHIRIVCTIDKPMKITQSLFVVDISGSMASDLDQVKMAIKYMCENGLSEPKFIIYNSIASIVSAEQVLQLNANGMTSFEAAFNKIAEVLQKGADDLTIVFMTDGEDTVSKDLSSAERKPKQLISTLKKKIVFNSIGFGKNSHRQFLENITKYGKEAGVYRYAEGKDLNTKFEEMFDFLEMTSKVSLTINDQSYTVDAEYSSDGYLVDTIIRNIKNSESSLKIIINDEVKELKQCPADSFFNLKLLEDQEIRTQEDLTKIQIALNEINPLKTTKENRTKLFELKRFIQNKLDQYHQLFSQNARNSLDSNSLASQLNSLRHDVKFSKARRARSMAKRAQSNATDYSQIKHKLAALKPNLEQFATLDLICTLTSSSILEIMTDNAEDFMVFTLRVVRPEYAIDAPTQLNVEKILVGTYSFEAFRDSMTYSINSKGVNAHGGFALDNNENVGLFKGPDGQLMNACLPLYINEDHWNRVKLQIKPILGYFFTLDPLGFKEDQYIALFMILGTMICQRANNNFTNEWADWLINDFKQLCCAIKPLALKYLQSGKYCNTVRNDLLADFLASPKWRTKEMIPNIMVIVGWHFTESNEINEKRYYLAFVEELWRRNFTKYYSGQAREIVLEVLEKLILIPTDLNQLTDEEAITHNKPSKDKEFAMWAQYRFNQLSHNKMKAVHSKWGSSGPTFEPSEYEAEYVPQKLIRYEENSEYLDKFVNSELAKIKSLNQFVDSYYKGYPTGNGFTGKEKWLMLIQALQYCSNNLMNTACANGSYKNTYDYIDKIDQLVTDIYNEFERKRRENWNAIVKTKSDLLIARHIVVTRDLDSFMGRLMKACPTRGGTVFENVVSLCSTDPAIPLLAEKIKILMTGKYRYGENSPVSVISNGEAWIQCGPETVKRFISMIGSEAFSQIEMSMYGSSGWVYRLSDLPNRHSHCNSNPNPLLRWNFSGFKL